MRLKSGWAAHQWPHHRVTRLTCAQAGRGGAYTALICSRAKGTRDGFGAVVRSGGTVGRDGHGLLVLVGDYYQG